VAYALSILADAGALGVDLSGFRVSNVDVADPRGYTYVEFTGDTSGLIDWLETPGSGFVSWPWPHLGYTGNYRQENYKRRFKSEEEGG
jgi:hypothetical protein